MNVFLYGGKAIRFLKGVKSLFFVLDKRNFLYFLGLFLLSIPHAIKNKNLEETFFKMQGRLCRFKVFGQTVMLDGWYSGYATEIYARKVYFTLPDFRIHKNDTVIDLGANAGVFTVLAALLCKKVIAVEADFNIVEKLKETIQLNNCSDKTEIIWGIVGYNSGIFADPVITQKHLGGNTPPKISFNQIIKKHNVETVDFLKIDIEGSEFDLFRQGINWLSRVRLIAMEVHPEFGDAEELRNTLENNGFKVWFVDVNQKIVPEIKESAGYIFAKNLAFKDNLQYS